MAEGRQVVEILLVEDNPGDVRLIQEVLAQGHVRSELAVVRDGVEALAYLRQQGVHTSARRPNLVLLDLNLPRMNGQETLAEIKADPALRHIPVVILTSSQRDEDVLRAYDLHANCYVSKPVELDRFWQVIHSIEGFWLTTAKLPPG